MKFFSTAVLISALAMGATAQNATSTGNSTTSPTPPPPYPGAASQLNAASGATAMTFMGLVAFMLTI
ncbi:hypothetical protein H072_261 [Dactylellina haptotyla CBS 200.50]|uniref:Uncharacterized protein n=1 Tax=Dactylellina haptotyla (strain CBS 200.50) TaxID=1284197 RepID=S8CDK0_DACHA|nr:hypothetical protein H072_261 [Dactylellina haptotyla CBS 200.50]